MTKQVNDYDAHDTDAMLMEALESDSDAIPAYDDNDYSEDTLAAVGNAGKVSGEQTIISTDENAHQVAWTINMPDSPVYRAGMFAYIAGLNAKVRQYNAENPGKVRPTLQGNPDSYTLVRVVTRLSESRVKHEKLTAESRVESAGFLVQTYAVNRSTGAYFRVPGKIAQTYDSVLFYRYASNFNGKQGALFVMTRENGNFYDAMDSQHGKGYTVSPTMAQVTRVALEKATRQSRGFTAWTPRAFNAWIAENVTSESGETTQPGF